MKTVKRFDIGSLSKIEKTPQGFLKVPVYATRTGVFKYLNADGKMIGELRPEDEVFKPESLASLSAAPITLRHPPELVTPENHAKYSKGYLLEKIERDGDKVAGVAIIADASTIELVESGMKEVSCGYVAELEESPGIFDGEPYQFIQRNIKYNHLAIVSQGRAGPEVALRLDSNDDQLPLGVIMEKVKVMIAGKEFEVEPALAEALKMHMQQMEDECSKKMQDMAPKSEMEAMKQEKEQMQAKMDQLGADLEKAKAVKTDEAEKVDVRKFVKERLNIEKVAVALGVEKSDEMEDLELKKAVILKDSPKADLAEKSDAYIAARFDAISEKLDENKSLQSAIGAALTTPKQDHDEATSDAARKRMMERDDNLWKGTK